MTEPLTITFTFAEGDVWVDPDGVAWYVKHTGGVDVYFERTAGHYAAAVDVVRKWRKVGEPLDRGIGTSP